MEKLSNPKDIVGVKKTPMSTIPMPVIAEVGLAMLEGACKYGRHNYRAVGVRGSVYYDATMRHLIAWWEGEDIDPDSELSHITKAISSLVVLRDAMMQGKFEDDRPPKAAEFYKELNQKAGEIIDRHADKQPKHYTETDSKPANTLTYISDWIEYDGSGCPPVNGKLRAVVRYRHGDIGGPAPVDHWSWKQEGFSSDIMAYRLVDMP